MQENARLHFKLQAININGNVVLTQREDYVQ